MNAPTALPGKPRSLSLALALAMAAAPGLGLWPTAAGAEDAPPAAPAPASSPPAQRPALLPAADTLRPDPVPRDPRSLGTDAWTQITVAGKPVPLLHRPPAQAQASGTALIVSHRSDGPASAARAASLRTGLARHGFHTYLLALTPLASQAMALLDDAAREAEEKLLAARVKAAAEFVTGQHAGEAASGTQFANLLISEGASGRWLRQWDGAGLDALVFVDVPPPPRRADNWLLAAALPSLVVQTDPYRWSPEQPLSAGTELHLLPRQALRPPAGIGSRARPREDLVLRTVRGWVQRLFAPDARSRS